MDKPITYQPLGMGKGSLSEQVAEQIIDLIASRRLNVGDQLPPLVELTEHLAVSRTAVREAIKLLDAWGMVTVKHGVGTFVDGLPEGALTIPLRVSAERSGNTVWNLHQVRMVLEPGIATLAAENACPQHIQEMEDAIRKMDQTLDAPDEYIAADLAFHTALAAATGNDLFLMVLRPVIGLLNDAMHLAEKTLGAMEKGQTYHRMLLEHIKARSADKAKDAMKAHLDEVWRTLAVQLEKEN
jgi:GntR family transcriptional repressor for pyruvate dehydrogenase complex